METLAYNPFAVMPRPVARQASTASAPAATPELPSRGPEFPAPRPPAMSVAPADLVTPNAQAAMTVLAVAEAEAALPENAAPDPTVVSGEAYDSWAQAPESERRPGSTQGEYLDQLFDLPATQTNGPGQPYTEARRLFGNGSAGAASKRL